MADSYVEKVAGQLADLTLADQAASGDIGIVDTVAKVLGASSQTLEEAFLTAVRVRRAEERARALLTKRKESGFATAAPAPSRDNTEDPDDAEAADDTTAYEPPQTPLLTDYTGTNAPAAERPDDAEAADDLVDQAVRDKEATDDAIERLKRAGIGMPRRVQRE